MHIKTLHLKNFRRFEDASFEFGPGFNLLVGENGSGKSTVLEASIGAVSGFSTTTFGEKGDEFLNSTSIRQKSFMLSTSFRFEEQFPLQIEMIFVENNDEIIQSLHCENKLTIPYISKFMWNFWDNIMNDARLNFDRALPLIVSYPAKRGFLRSEIADPFLNSKSKLVSRLDAYLDWRVSSLIVEKVQEWFVDKTVERFENDIPLNDLVYPDELTFVNAAITRFVEGSRSFRYLRQHKSLIIEWQDGQRSRFDTLSDGQRGLISMVADIARRACLLNPHLGENVLRDTPGIVWIDELDLHLHPKWQRSIVKNLKETFPKIQFIATTHSPQIIGECLPEEIIIVTETGGKGGAGIDLSYGLDSNSVLETIMDTRERDPEIEKLVDQLFLAIDEQRFDAAATVLAALESKVGEIPEVIRARRLINRHHRRNSEAAE